MIRSVRASVWYSEDQSMANVYAQVDGKPDHMVITFYASDFKDGIASTSRAKSKNTKKRIEGVVTTLELPYDNDDDPVWRLTIHFAGMEAVSMDLPQDRESHYEDGTVRHNRPRASGSWESTDNRVSIHDWLEFQEATHNPEVKRVSSKMQRIRAALSRGDNND